VSYHFESRNALSLERGTAGAKISAKSELLSRHRKGRVSARRLVGEQEDAEMALIPQLPNGGTAAPTVLVVEDDPSLLMLCRVNLELESYRVLEAQTVQRAEELVSGEAVDVVLLDLHIGERQGLELLPLLRKERPAAAVCLLSGTSETDPPSMEGVDAFIRKPFELEDLLGTVQRLLSKEPVQP
jgi:CheY-like chemotaxis protein